MTQPHPLASVALGDIISLPGGGDSTVRGRVSWTLPAGTMTGFLVMGELENLLSLPSDSREQFLLYRASDQLPAELAHARVAYEGAFSYWSPHLPALQGAMGELLYRVFLIRGSVDPVVGVYRGSYEDSERIFFIRSSGLDSEDLLVRHMRRDVDNKIALTRHSAIVRVPVATPVPVREREDANAPR
jgi:hypothetical protein